MKFQSNPYLAWQVVSTMIILGIVFYIQTRPRKKSKARVLALMMFGGALWSLVNIIQWISPDFAWQASWNLLVYVGILIVPTAWFMFSIRYTGIGIILLEKLGLGIWLVPAITFIAIFTNDIHQLYYLDQKIVLINGFAVIDSKYGPLFYAHTVYSYLLLLSGMVILGYSLFSNFKKYGISSYGLVIGVLTPLLGNIYFLFGPIPEGFPDPTPFLFGITGIAFSWTIFGSRMLDVIEIAHDSIVKNLSNGIVVLDLDDNILDINPAATESLGLPIEDYIGRSFLEVIKNKNGLHDTLKTGLDRIKTRDQNILLQMIEKQNSYEVVISHIKDKFTKTTGLLLEFSDISEKIRAEENLASTREAFELTMDTLLDSYFEADLNGVITYVNSALIRALGLRNHGDVLGKHFRHFIHRKSIRDILEKFQLLYETRQPIKSIEYYFTRKDGEERIAEIAVSPLFEGTEIIGAKGIIRDITERKLQAARMATLYQVGLATTSSLDMDAILITIYEQCHQVLNANVFFVALHNGEKDEIDYPIFFDNGKRLEPFSVPLDTGLGGWIIRNQHPFLCVDLVAEEENLPIKMRRTGGEQTRSFVGVPLLGRKGAIGAIAIQSYRPGVYKEEDVQLLTTIAAQAAAAIENAQLYTEILKQKDLLDGLMRHSPLAIAINDIQSRIIVVNPAFEKLFGYSQEEALGKDLDDILSTPETAEEMRAISKQTMEETKEVYVEGKRKKKEGSLVDIELFTAPYYIGDQQYGYMVFYNDISERLKAEADFEKTQSTISAILDTLQDPYFEADKSGKITFVNDAFWKNTGYLSKEDVIGKNFRHFTDRKIVRQVFEWFQILYETKKPIEPFDYHYRKNDGGVQTAEIVVSPVFEAGEIVGSRGIIRDISVRIKAEDVLRQAKEAAEYRAGELATINRVAEKVGQTLDLQEILDSVCRELSTIFEVKNAGIGLLNREENVLEIVAYYTNIPGDETAQGVIIPVEGNSYFQEIDDHKETIVIQNAQTDPRMKASHELFRDRGTMAIMIVPLLIRGRVIGNIGLPALDPNHQFSEAEIELAETIASQIASAIDNAQLYAKTESALDVAERDLEIGRQIQSGFFPEQIPEIQGWEIAASFEPARQVAGDFYDAFQFRESNFAAFIIADVCDKGVGAALFMVLFRSLLRAFSERQIDTDNVQDQLLDIVSKTNDYISLVHGKSNMFATLFFGILDTDNGILHYVNGGHEPPLILNKNIEIMHRLMPTGPAVGMFPNMIFEAAEIQFDPGDLFVGFTDGIIDAKNMAGDLFSEERLLEKIVNPWNSAFSMLFELNTEVQKHIGEQQQFDDITLIAFKRKPNEAADSHTLSRAAQIEMLSEMRGFVEAAARHCGLSAENTFAFKLAAEEICTNIIQYGYEDHHVATLVLSFSVEGNQARLIIQDDGKHFSPDKAKKPDIDGDWKDREVGGLGIYLVKEIMDKVTYNRNEEDGNTLIMEKKLSR